MSRSIDSTLAAGLANANIQPFILAALTFASGTVYVWSGVGDLPWNGNTYQGVGALGSVSSISEGSGVQADGMTLTLSGIPIAGLNIPYTSGSTPPSGVTPPVTVPTGQSVAWLLPTAAIAESDPRGTISGCSGIGTGPFTTGASATPAGGHLYNTGGCTLGSTFPTPSPSVRWSGFNPGKLPLGAVIEAIYPTAAIAGIQQNADHTFTSSSDDVGTQTVEVTGDPFSGQYNTASIGITADDISSAQIGYRILRGGSGGPDADEATISYVALAVYYTPGTPSLMTETLDDIQLGAPAKVYLGLMQDGAILGTPYLIFGGTIDQPNIRIGPDTMTISLALENKLTNLQRANQRRYTSADQRLQYPDDTAFSWVELENDIAFRWGG